MIDQIFRKTYEETRSIYALAEPELGAAALGFRVLYGPPIVGAPYLFLGYQPGGSEIEDIQHHDGWPIKSDYAVKNWPLARHIRDIFGPEIVAGCTGLNAIFFRSPNVKAWMSLPSPLRLKLEEFSLTRSEAIVRVLQPKHIVIIGTGNFDLLTKGKTVLRGGKGVTLAKIGTLWDTPATGTVHLSGYRLSGGDKELLRQYFSVASS